MTRGRRSAAPAEVHLHIRRLWIDDTVDGAAAAGSAGFQAALQNALVARLGTEWTADAVAPGSATPVTRSIADAVAASVRSSIGTSDATPGDVDRG